MTSHAELTLQRRVRDLEDDLALERKRVAIFKRALEQLRVSYDVQRLIAGRTFEEMDGGRNE